MKLLSVACVSALVLLLSAPVSTVPYLWIKFPQVAGSFGRDFAVEGIALNSDVVHIWAFPTSGAVFLGAAWTDHGDTDHQLDTGHFNLMLRNAPIGTYPLVVYAHDPVMNTFPTQASVTLTVRACVPFTVQWLMSGPSGPTMVSLPWCG